MKVRLLPLALTAFISGCIVLPVTDPTHYNKCEISSDKKTIKVFNLHEDNNNYYSIGGILLLPLTGVVSGTYVAVHNVYHLGEEIIVCGSQESDNQEPVLD
ncbi:hypothetical protein ORJ66_13855 [Pseudoalteromonas tunicata]|uniref:hypothetical protein n=1 Tax=Pseudoalteromonas tunicata TaxID=314281 RepID=UPI00273E8C6E|nr:hypothetical protein [Pseudoalteromonas tunicata]MDP5214134.1 hypothetical protein [Pseudoalteromonas tunicata]